MLNTLVYDIDSHLSWNDHIDYICSKISKNLSIITRLTRYLTSQSLCLFTILWYILTFILVVFCGETIMMLLYQRLWNHKTKLFV